MAHHSIIAIPKNGQKIPMEIVEKARDFYYLFQRIPEQVTWLISEERIMLCGWQSFFNLKSELEDELFRNHISKNMIDVYEWICKNAEVSSDCKNVCDFEYGPDCVDELVEKIQCAVENVKSWEGPISNMTETELKLLIMRYNQEKHSLCLDLQGKQLEVMLPDTLLSVREARIYGQETLIVGNFFRETIEIDLVYEIYQARYVDTDIDPLYVYDIISTIQEAKREGTLIQVFMKD